LTPAEWEQAQRPPVWIGWHRRVFGPVTRARRAILERLGARPPGKKIKETGAY